MAHTVVGFFDDPADAQRAAEKLAENGISRDRVDISSSTGSQSENAEYNQDKDNGLKRFFKALFGDDEQEAERYTKVGNSGCSLVTVHATSSQEAEQAANLLDACGAINVDERAEYAGYGRTGADMTRDMARDSNRGETTSHIREDVNFDNRSEQAGNVRVRSRIMERPVEEHVRLREENVRVERNPVDRVANNNNLENFKEGEIEITERKEVPVINKEARVVEEIRLQKNVEEREEIIRTNVIETEVDIDDSNGYNRNNKSSDISSRNEDKRKLNDADERTDENNNRSSNSINRRSGDPLFGA